jgi:CubicO group peptidase (beta-lactamase class C family)
MFLKAGNINNLNAMKLIFITYLLPLFLIFSLGTVQAQSVMHKLEINPDLLSPKIDSLLSEWDSTEKPSVSIAVVHDGEILYKRGLGMANLEYDIPNTPSTIFNIASVSKQFTAFSILLLQENGKLSLDDNIEKYLPEVPDFGHTITLRHLITHTSGLRDQNHLLWLKGLRPDDVITNEHILSLISQQQELNFIPGEEYLYCNTGFTLLAEVVARVSGQTFAKFTQDHIFTPLQMRSTSFNDDHEKIIKNTAYSYYSNNEEYKKRVLSSSNVGPTNLISTVEDLSKWTINFKQHTVGSIHIFNEMKSPATLNSGETIGGGMGLFTNKYHGITEIEHGGAEAGFRAQLSMFPSQNFAVIVLSNNAGFDAHKVTFQVTDLYLHDLYHDPIIAPDKKRNYITLSPKEVEPFLGHYWNKNHGFTRNIYLKNDTLMHFRIENNESWLAPISKNTFKVMDVPPDVIVQFQNNDGKVIMIETVNNGENKILETYSPKVYTEEDWLMYDGLYYSEELETFYSIDWNKEDKLIAKHMRMGSVMLSQLKHNFFIGNKGYFGNVEFLRDENDDISGFRVSNGRVRNLLFVKQHTKKGKMH